MDEGDFCGRKEAFQQDIESGIMEVCTDITKTSSGRVTRLA